VCLPFRTGGCQEASVRPAIFSRFEDFREKNVVELKRASEAGRKIVGTYCIYSPCELIVAAGAIPVLLCGTRQAPIHAAEQVLPHNLCPLIKSSYGFALTDTCPYFHFSNLIVGETTCDGKKKMYEYLSELKPMHLLQLPQRQDRPQDQSYWLREVETLKERLEEECSVSISDEAMRGAIRLLNEERRSSKDLQDICKIKPSPISGLDLLTVLHMRNFFLDKEEATAMVDSLTAELREMADRGESPFNADTPRILLTGVPIGVGSEKVVRIVEESGGSVVCFENCSGYKKLIPIDEGGEPLRAIAEKYLKTPCSCMSPNEGRFELVERLVGEFRVDGVIDLTWLACHTYNVESYRLKEYLGKKVNVPFFQIETDYSESDVGPLKTRIQAFIEILGNGLPFGE
jgi:benzoyl-CoA reductase/2-hydroxyglutaryl-CoA dehydratase subunit BcrC/BadD/HgdB